MKEIIIRTSSITAMQLGAVEYTHYITFPAKPDYAYTIRCTNEGFGRMTALWKEAGYTLVFDKES